jgi:hypothetical protein
VKPLRINKLGIITVLAVLLLVCAAGASAGKVPQPPTSWKGVGCMRYSAGGADNIICLYDGTPFKMYGISKGGASTLTYAVQCKKPVVPWEKQVVYPQVWYKASKSVSGSFAVLGKKAALNAAMKYCNSSYKRTPILIASLKRGRRPAAPA